MTVGDLERDISITTNKVVGIHLIDGVPHKWQVFLIYRRGSIEVHCQYFFSQQAIFYDFRGGVKESFLIHTIVIPKLALLHGFREANLVINRREATASEENELIQDLAEALVLRERSRHVALPDSAVRYDPKVIFADAMGLTPVVKILLGMSNDVSGGARPF
jgi:hypothetical protein